VCLRVCVCVCEREREKRGGERRGDFRCSKENVKEFINFNINSPRAPNPHRTRQSRELSSLTLTLVLGDQRRDDEIRRANCKTTVNSSMYKSSFRLFV